MCSFSSKHLRRDFFELWAIQEASGQKSHKNLRAHFAFDQNARPCCSIIGESGFCDVFVESGRVVNDFIQSLTLVLQGVDLRNFEEPFEAVSLMFVYRIFVCKLYGLYAMEIVFAGRFRLVRLEIEFPEYTLQNRRSEMFIVT